MIKEIITANEIIAPNEREIAVLKEYFPTCFKADGSFDIERFKEFLSDKVNVNHEGYELKFLGKNYARLLASVDTTTVIIPDEEHNKKPENTESQNVYISGDNLDGLKHLLKSYSRKVKCIYIDPPYNTGTDGFVYNDRFNFTIEQLSTKLSISEEQAQRILDMTKRGSASHSAWMMFMYPRLLLARDLLTEDGVIFISIDDNEQANLKLLCDDVFGEENFVSQLIVTVKPEGRRYGFFAKTHDYANVYCKNSDKLGLNEIEVEGAEYQYFDDVGGFNLKGLRNRNVQAFNSSNRPNLRYPFYVDISNPDKDGLCCVSTVPQVGWVEVYPSINDGLESVWRWGKAKSTALASVLVAYKGNDNEIRVFQKERKLTQTAKTVLKIAEKNAYDELLEDKDIISNKGTKEVQDLLGKGVFDFPKPLKLIETFINIGTNEDDIVVDFFSGSATTAHAVMKINVEDGCNRSFVMVQLQEAVKPESESEKQGYKTIDQIGIERIIRAAKNIKEQNPDTIADLGFRHFTLVEQTDDTLDKLEKFDPNENKLYADKTLLDAFGKPTILATWIVRDGYGLTANPEELDFAGYKGYYIGKHLYLIDPELSNKAIEAIVVKYETNGSFNPENVVLFGYSFTWTEMEALKTNLKRLKDTEKNLRINFDIRY